MGKSSVVSRVKGVSMIDEARRTTAGTVVYGTFRCVKCGYGVVVNGALPACPMCRGKIWEEAE